MRKSVKTALLSVILLMPSAASAQIYGDDDGDVERVNESIASWHGDFSRLGAVITNANQVRPSARGYNRALFIRGVAASILVSAYNESSFALPIGSRGTANIVSYSGYFGSLFRYSSPATLRRQWDRVAVMIAVSSPTECDMSTVLGDARTFVGHWMNGARDPIRPSVTFGVSLTPSRALSDASWDAAEAACRSDRARRGIFEYPRFVVVGKMVCNEANCSSLPRFLVSDLFYTYSNANALPGYGDYMRTTFSILSRLRRMGVR